MRMECTKKQRNNGKGGSNKGHNKNRNGCRPDSIDNPYSTEKFKGEVEGLSHFGAKEDKQTDSLMVFQKEVHM